MPPSCFGVVLLRNGATFLLWSVQPSLPPLGWNRFPLPSLLLLLLPSVFGGAAFLPPPSGGVQRRTMDQAPDENKARVRVEPGRSETAPRACPTPPSPNRARLRWKPPPSQALSHGASLFQCHFPAGSFQIVIPPDQKKNLNFTQLLLLSNSCGWSPFLRCLSSSPCGWSGLS